MRRLYATSASSGARDTTTNAHIVVFQMGMLPASRPAIAEQLGQPSFQSGPEHEVIDEHLPNARRRDRAATHRRLGREPVVLVNLPPRAVTPPVAQVVAAVRQFLFSSRSSRRAASHSSRVPTA